MKIEKISDNQILCTVTKQDLDERHIEISQLAYGSDATRALFRDILQQAADELDFQLDSMHLMVEIIPMDLETLEFVITKVSVPEELDTRFSNFRPSVTGSQEQTDQTDGSSSAANDITGIIRSLLQRSKGSDTASSGPAAQAADPPQRQASSQGSGNGSDALRSFVRLNRLFLFKSLADACHAAASVKGFTGESSLYFQQEQQNYGLILKMSDTRELAASQSVIAALTEYGTSQVLTPARLHALEEHGTLIIGDHAIQKLAEI